MILLLLLYIPVSAINYLELDLDILEVYQYVVRTEQQDNLQPIYVLLLYVVRTPYGRKYKARCSINMKPKCSLHLRPESTIYVRTCYVRIYECTSHYV